MTRPNLFEFATSELSQDAFICWLISWASPECASADPPLHKTAIALLNKVFELKGVAPPVEYESVVVKKQCGNIDVLIVVNGDIPIIIEDKTYTCEHSGQLARYFDGIGKRFDPHKIIGIYLKTGDQSSYRHVKDANFVPLRRQHLIEVLAHGMSLGVRNDIFDDFRLRLEAINASVNAYVSTPPQNWNAAAWTGFFMELQHRLGDGSWGYVANPSGGFMGFSWHERNDGVKKYLQLEEKELCFKIEVHDKEKRAEYWKNWHATFVATSPQVGVTLKRPRRRSGTWMTVALLDGEYRKTKDDGLLDLDATVAVLRMAEQLLDLSVARNVEDAAE